ncbi:MAG: exodeoxyribonuclease III [Actinomycetia bacterium]|nr:exodeoxyribonuclease III [Actinomycetes bacterium]MCP3913749.1 exodeoxyribonuclease III [Actinomycetes bacterium]MCP4086218.1 exodeoxyribonuclease III [Actinomycetes bacterium]
MRIVSWNVNSIRTRRDRVVDWLTRHQPDIVLLQETKCVDDDLGAEAFEALGYEVAHWGINHWNGVAIISRVGLASVQKGFPGAQRSPYDEARFLSATCGGLRVHSIYVPNGRELDDPHYLFKLVWLERLRAAIDPDQPTVAAGDFNVAPADADIYDPKRWRRRTHASPPERAAIDALLDRGLIDVTRRHLPEPETFTWWSYRPGQFEKNQGLRIDLALVTPDVASRSTGVWIDTDERAGERPSDHAPLVLDLDNP